MCRSRDMYFAFYNQHLRQLMPLMPFLIQLYCKHSIAFDAFLIQLSRSIPSSMRLMLTATLLTSLKRLLLTGVSFNKPLHYTVVWVYFCHSRLMLHKLMFTDYYDSVFCYCRESVSEDGGHTSLHDASTPWWTHYTPRL